jgi:hypothetical protein
LHQKSKDSKSQNGLEGDREEAVNAGSEHESVSSECETEDDNCKDTETEIDNRDSEQRESGETE